MGFKTLRRLFKVLPKSIRYPILRRLVQINPPNPAFSHYEAVTQEDLVEAKILKNRVYSDSGLTPPFTNPNEKKRIFVCKAEGRVIGTAAVTEDVTSKQVFNLNRFQGKRLGEITSLAIDKSYRGMSSDVFLPLIRLAWLEADKSGIEVLIATTNPKWADFYCGLLLFKEIGIVDRYYPANGAPAICMYLDLKTARQRFLKVYGRSPEERNLYSFFVLNSASK